MKLNKKGFAVTSIIYSMLVLFLGLTLLISSNMASRKAAFDKEKNEILSNIEESVIPEDIFVPSSVSIDLSCENGRYLKEGANTCWYYISIDNYDSNSDYEIYEDKIYLDGDSDTGSILSFIEYGPGEYEVAVLAGSGNGEVRLHLEEDAITKDKVSIIPASGITADYDDYLYIDNTPPTTPYVVYSDDSQVCYPETLDIFSTNPTFACKCTGKDCEGENHCALLETQSLCNGISYSQYKAHDNFDDVWFLTDYDQCVSILIDLDINTEVCSYLGFDQGYSGCTNYPQELYVYNVFAVDRVGNISDPLYVSILNIPRWSNYYGNSSSISSRYIIEDGSWKYQSVYGCGMNCHEHSSGSAWCVTP